MKHLRFLFAAIILNICSISGFAQIKNHRIKVINLDSSASNYFIVFSEGNSKSVIVSPKHIDSGNVNSRIKIEIGHTYSLNLQKIDTIQESVKVNKIHKADSLKFLTLVCAVPKGHLYYFKGKKVPLYKSEAVTGLYIIKADSD